MNAETTGSQLFQRPGLYLRQVHWIGEVDNVKSDLIVIAANVDENFSIRASAVGVPNDILTCLVDGYDDIADAMLTAATQRRGFTDHSAHQSQRFGT